jgi:hypothetical protein
MTQSAAHTCRYCRSPMRRTTRIAAVGRTMPGLQIWECGECGTVDSDVIHPGSHFGSDQRGGDAR